MLIGQPKAPEHTSVREFLVDKKFSREIKYLFIEIKNNEHEGQKAACMHPEKFVPVETDYLKQPNGSMILVNT